jgi:hypothetical protein
MLLEHLQRMEQRLTASIQDVRADVQTVEGKLTKRIDRLEVKLTTQLDGIDERLDGLEIEHLPRRIAALEQRFGR